MSELLPFFWPNENYLTGLKSFLQALGSTLGDKEIMHLQDQFNAIDVDKNGAITFEEIREVKILIHLNVLFWSLNGEVNSQPRKYRGKIPNQQASATHLNVCKYSIPFLIE